MGIASIVHLYVFPAKPYELMGDHLPGSVSVLGDYSADCPLDPDEIRDSERPTKLRLPTPDVDSKSGMTIRESVRDVVIGGGGYVSFLKCASIATLFHFLWACGASASQHWVKSLFSSKDEDNIKSF